MTATRTREAYLEATISEYRAVGIDERRHRVRLRRMAADVIRELAANARAARQLQTESAAAGAESNALQHEARAQAYRDAAEILTRRLADCGEDEALAAAVALGHDPEQAAGDRS